MRRGDNERAFAMTERACARSLAEQQRAADLPTLTTVQRMLAADFQLSSHSTNSSRTAIWIIVTSMEPR